MNWTSFSSVQHNQRYFAVFLSVMETEVVGFQKYGSSIWLVRFYDAFCNFWAWQPYDCNKEIVSNQLHRNKQENNRINNANLLNGLQ